MKSRTKYLLVVLVILGGLGVGLGLSKISATKRAVGTRMNPAPLPPAAADNRPLKERAKTNGHYVTSERPNRNKTYADLKDLTENSSAVIVGIPEDNVSTLSQDGRSISIDYKTKVMYTFKGTIAKGNTITVSIPGGRVQFEDGSSAEVRTPWFKKMMAGNAYVLFLNPDGRPGVFVTTGDAQGLFEIPKYVHKDEKVIVKTHSGLPGDQVRKYEATDAWLFLRELRRVTGKQLEHSATSK
jgi:hypothetical protein